MALLQAVSSSQSQYDESIKEWFGNDYYGNICNSGKAEAAAKAIAIAVAKVYTQAYQQVECSDDADGSFCGWQQSNGDAWGIATAEAVATAMADAGDDDAKGFCFSDVQAISVVVADAAAQSLQEGCSSGVASSYKFTESSQTAVQKGIAKAFAKASASACKSGKYEASASSKCEGEGLSKSRGKTSSSGDGFAKGGQVSACTSGVARKCCPTGHTSRICTCALKNG